MSTAWSPDEELALARAVRAVTLSGAQGIGCWVRVALLLRRLHGLPRRSRSAGECKNRARLLGLVV